METLTLTKQEIKEWCDENGYLLVKKQKEMLPPETIKAISEKVCYIEDGKFVGKHRQGQFAFSRYLVITYYYPYVAPNLIKDIVGLGHCMISHAMKQDLFNPANFRFLTSWQQYAVTQFRYEVEILGGQCKYVKRITRNSNQ